MRKTTDIRERIAVRAYFAWLNGSTAGAGENWIEAEAVELAYAERRATAARKAAETRKARAPVTTAIVTNCRTRRGGARPLGPTACS